MREQAKNNANEPAEKREKGMKKGILVYDRADAEYNKWFIERIISVGAESGLDIRLVLSENIGEIICKETRKETCEEIYEEMREKMCYFAIMRNRNYKLSQFFEKKGIRCFNSSYVCKIGNDKWEMYKDFQSAGIPVMYTQKSRLPYPFVMKPVDGHGGKNVFLVNCQEEFETAIAEISKDEPAIHKEELKIREGITEISKNMVKNLSDSAYMSGRIREKYIYQLIASEKGRDIRVYVLGNTIVTAMERRVSEGRDEFRANFSLGGSATEYALTEEELRLVAKVAEHIKPDFVGIDLIYNNGKPVVNEVEDAVGTRMLYSETDIDAVQLYINWICSELNS